MTEREPRSDSRAKEGSDGSNIASLGWRLLYTGGDVEDQARGWEFKCQKSNMKLRHNVINSATIGCEFSHGPRGSK